MSEFRLAPEAAGSLPYLGHGRDEDLRAGQVQLPAGRLPHRIIENDVVLILHVVHGSRDIAGLFGRDL